MGALQERHAERSRAEQRSRAEVYRTSAKAREERESRVRLALERVEGGLFAEGPQVHPVAPQSVDIPAFANLPVGEAPDVWRSCVPGGHTILGGFMRHPRLPHSSYVLAALQALLRVPCVAIWLGEHAARCGAEASSDDLCMVCISCAVWRSRSALCQREVAELVLRRSLVGEQFAGLEQQL